MPLSPLRVAPGGRYFETFDGEPFLLIGFNDAISWPGLNGLFRRRDLPAVRLYLEDLKAHGINTLRLMLEYAETGQHVNLSFDSAARHQYTASFDDYASRLRTVALRNNGRYLGISSDVPVDEAIFGPMVESGTLE